MMSKQLTLSATFAAASMAVLALAAAMGHFAPVAPLDGSGAAPLFELSASR